MKSDKCKYVGSSPARDSTKRKGTIYCMSSLFCNSHIMIVSQLQVLKCPLASFRFCWVANADKKGRNCIQFRTCFKFLYLHNRVLVQS